MNRVKPNCTRKCNLRFEHNVRLVSLDAVRQFVRTGPAVVDPRPGANIVPVADGRRTFREERPFSASPYAFSSEPHRRGRFDGTNRPFAQYRTRARTAANYVNRTTVISSRTDRRTFEVSIFFFNVRRPGTRNIGYDSRDNAKRWLL